VTAGETSGGDSSFDARGLTVPAVCCAAGAGGILAAGGLSRPLYRRFTGTAFLGAPAAGARVDFAGTGLFAAGSGAFTAQRHVEDLLPSPADCARIMTVSPTPESKRRPHRESRYGRRCRDEVPSTVMPG
jgi:hypothetical protein